MDAAAALRDLIAESRRIVVFTGAGISTESGIPDYRGQGGLWEKYRPVTYDEFLSSGPAREEYWRRKLALYESFVTARPNAAHLAVARLESGGKLLGLVTQNIDGLHEMAGNSPAKTIELHGTNRLTVCLRCRKTEDWTATHARLRAGEKAPLCACGGLLKPATVSFGEALNPDRLRDAAEWSESGDLMLVVGSTLIVEPAASLPRLAKRAGARLAIVNMSETPLDAEADLLARGRAGEILQGAVP